MAELQHIRYQSGVGTRFESDEATRDLRSVGDWGKDGADAHGSVLATEHGRGRFKTANANPLREVSAAFFRNAAKHPLAARKALAEEVQEMATDYYSNHHHGARINADKARIEQLADAVTLGGTKNEGTNDLVGKEMVREANKGLFGSSLTGLVRNVFGGPKSSIYQYSSEHHAQAGKYHWSALGEPHWDANGDPIVSKAAPNDRGLAGAGVKMTNSLKELYKDVDAPKNKQVSGKGEMHLVRLMDNLLYGKRVKPVPRDLRAEHKKVVADYSRQLAEHKFDNKMLVDKKSSFFSDDEDNFAEEPNVGLVTKMLEPDAVTAVADKSPVAKKLKDDEMLISGEKGFFRDTNDENPMDKVISSEEAQQEDTESSDKMMDHEKRIHENTQQVRKLEHKRAAEAAQRGAEDVKDFRVVHAVAQNELDAEHERDVHENHRLAKSDDVDKFFGGVNGQSGRITAIKPAQKRSDLLARAEQSVVRAEKREQTANRKVRVDTRREQKEREEVTRIEEREERKGIAQAAREAKAEQAATDQRVVRDEIRRQERVATPKARALKGGLLEAREVPAKSGKKVELHVSGNEERHAVADYFKNLEKEDDLKHKLAVSVIHKEERPHIKMHARADGTDRRDTKRDDKFFDKIAQHDMSKSKHARELRLQHQKDQRSLDFYEAVDRTLAREKAEDKRKVKTVVVPKAYEEWQHAEDAMGVDKVSKGVASTATRQQPAVVRAASTVKLQTQRAGATRKHEAASTTNKGIVPDLQAQIKAAIKSAIQKDVAPQVDNAVASGIQRALSSKLSARSTTTQSEQLTAAPAEQRKHVAARVAQSEHVSKVKAPYKSQYDYQKKHLATVLDTPEPSAKKQLDKFLSNPISSVESLF